MSFSELTSQQWLDLGLSVLLFIATAVLVNPLFNLILDRLLGRFIGRTANKLDDTLLGALRPPLVGLVLLLGFQIAILRLDFLPEYVPIGFEDIFFVGYLLVATIAAWRLVSALTKWYSQAIAPHTPGRLDEQILPFARRLTHLMIAAIGLIILLDHFGIEVSALVATLGIGSLAIALAAQAALSDTISGFLIMVDQPYRIGDRIELLDLDTWGDVVDIGLRSTRIRTRDNRMVIVPNSLIGKSLIVNHSYPDTSYRLQMDIDVAYGSDLEHVRSTLIEAVKTVAGVMPDQPVEALLLRFGESGLNFRVRWWLNDFVDTRRMFDKVNTAIYNALQHAGIEIPFPQRVVHHQIDEDNATRLRG